MTYFFDKIKFTKFGTCNFYSGRIYGFERKLSSLLVTHSAYVDVRVTLVERNGFDFL